MYRSYKDIKAALVRIVDNREFCFKDSRQVDAMKFLEECKTFKGVSPSDIIKLEMECHGNFPDGFKAFLSEMGLKSGRLFFNSLRCGTSSQEELRKFAEDLLEDNEYVGFLEQAGFIFLLNEGFSFYYIRALRERDSSIYCYEIGEEVVKVAESIEEFIDFNVSRLERNNKDALEDGGYFLSINEYGHMALEFNFDGGKMPLEIGDQFI